VTDRRGTLLAALLFLGAASPAMALNWVPLLKNSPAERFDDDDLQMFLANARKAVNEMPDNQTVSWENPDTKANGDITVLRTFEKDGKTCKRVRVRNEAGGRRATSVVDACKVGTRWRLISAPVRQ
jgi:surface antigen